MAFHVQNEGLIWLPADWFPAKKRYFGATRADREAEYASPLKHSTKVGYSINGKSAEYVGDNETLVQSAIALCQSPEGFNLNNRG